MIEIENIMSKGAPQTGHCELTKDIYMNIHNNQYISQKKLLFAALIANSLIKIAGAVCELKILNTLRVNILNGLSNVDIINIMIDSLGILFCIYQDKNLLNIINDAKQQLKLIKEEAETLKKLSKTIK